MSDPEIGEQSGQNEYNFHVSVEADDSCVVNPGSADDGCVVNPGSADNSCVVNPGSADDGCVVNPGSADDGCVVNPGSADDGCVVNPGSADNGYEVNPESADDGCVVNPGSADDGCVVNPGSADNGCVVNPGSADDSCVVNPGSADDGYVVNPGSADDGCVVNPGSADNGCVVNPGSADDGCVVNPGSADDDCVVNPGSADDDCVVNPGSADDGYVVNPGSADDSCVVNPGSADNGYVVNPGSADNGYVVNPGSVGQVCQDTEMTTEAEAQIPGVEGGNLKPESDVVGKENQIFESSSAHKSSLESINADFLQTTVDGSLQRLMEALLSQDTLNASLLEMCRQGECLVEELVRAGADVQTEAEDGWTPLLLAANEGHTEIVKFLLQSGADLNHANSAGDTALMLSIQPAGPTEVVKLLLQEKEINHDHRNLNGQTALTKAIETRNIEAINLLMNRRAVCNIPSQNKTDVPLSSSVSDQSIEELQDIASKAGLGNILKYFHGKKQTSSPVIEAALARDTESLKIFMECKFCRVQQTEEVFSFLVEFVNEQQRGGVEVSDNDLPVIDMLSENGANVDHNTLMFAAIEAGSYGLVNLLCKHGAKLDMRSHMDNKTPVAVAAENGRVNIVNLLIDFRAPINDDYRNYKNMPRYSGSALDLCLRNGHTACADILLTHGAHLDVSIAILSAVECRSVPYLEFLLNSNECRSQVREYLRNENNNISVLCKAIQTNNTKFVATLLDAGCSVNQTERLSRNLLTWAQSPEMVQLLLKYGADLYQKTSDWAGLPVLTAFIRIWKWDNDGEKVNGEVLQVLLANGVNINEVTKLGLTPLMLAAATPNNVSTLLKVLVSHGADLNARDRNGNTALMCAIEQLGFENAKCLIECLADLNVRNSAGSTALMFAVRIHSFELINTLTAYGADVNIQDNKGDTALTWVVKDCQLSMEEKIKMLQTFIEAGGKVNLENHKGLSALMLAAQNIETKVVETLVIAGAYVNAVSHGEDKETAFTFLLKTARVDKKMKKYKKATPSWRDDALACADFLLVNGASLSHLKLQDLMSLIRESDLRVIPRLISHGLVPLEVSSDSLPKVGVQRYIPYSISLFCYTLLQGQLKLARCFDQLWFLTPFDVSLLTYSPVIRNIVNNNKEECENVFNKSSSFPMSLEKLSFVVVSSAIGGGPGRKDRINSLPIPPAMKEILLFRRSDIYLDLPEDEEEEGEDEEEGEESELMEVLISGFCFNFCPYNNVDTNVTDHLYSSDDENDNSEDCLYSSDDSDSS